MTAKTPDPFSFSAEQLDKMAAEYENGTWEGHGKVLIGRPPLFDEDMETVSFRLPVSRIESVEAVSRKLGMSKSEFFRHAVDQALIAAAI